MKNIFSISALFFLFACEVADEDPLVGSWIMTDIGEYTNANCSGPIDRSNYQMEGETIMTFMDGGIAFYTVTVAEIEYDLTLTGTWDSDKSEFCIGLDENFYECQTYQLSGNIFTIDDKQAGNCVDKYNRDIDDYTTKTTCLAAGELWEDAECGFQEFTKQ